MNEDQKEFEFIANGMNLNLSKQEGEYAKLDTKKAWEIWQVAKSGKTKEFMLEWDDRKRESEKYVGDLSLFLKAVDTAIDESYSKLDLTSHVVNDKSESLIEQLKNVNKRTILNKIELADNIVGIRWLVCGLKEEDHKRVKSKVRDIVSGLTKGYSKSYDLDILLFKKASSTVLVKDYYGLRLSERILNLVDKCKYA